MTVYHRSECPLYDLSDPCDASAHNRDYFLGVYDQPTICREIRSRKVGGTKALVGPNVANHQSPIARSASEPQNHDRGDWHSPSLF